MSTSAISSTGPQTQPVTRAAGYSRTNSLDLTLTTRDGDTVTISAHQTTTAGVSTTTGANGDATAAAKTTSSSISVSADGSLDKDERADIKQVLKSLAEGARSQVLHGHHHGHRRHERHGDQGKGGLSTIEAISGSFSSSVAVLGGVLYGSPAASDGAATTPTDQTPAVPETTDTSAAA